jgi:phage-related protein
MKEKQRTVIWVGSSKNDLMKLPSDVVSDVGFGLYQAQLGEHPDSGKTLRTCLKSS